MTPLLLIAATLGQYGGGYTAGHCVGSGYCGFHGAYHQQAAFVADPHYYANVVAGYLRQQAADAARAQANADLSAKLDRIEAALKAQQAPALAAPPPPPVPANPLAAALQRCASCHTGEGSSGGTAIFDAPGKLATLDLAAKTQIHEAVKSGRMPPKGGPLTPAERGVIADAIRSDLDAIASTLKD